MRATTKLLAAVAALIGLAVPVPVAVASTTGSTISISKDHYCYTEKPLVDLAPASCPKDAGLYQSPLGNPPVSVSAQTTVTAHYRTIAMDRPPVCYVPVRDAVLTIPPGSSSGTVVVQLLPCPLPEERFTLELFAPSMATVAEPRVVMTIRPV